MRWDEIIDPRLTAFRNEWPTSHWSWTPKTLTTEEVEEMYAKASKVDSWPEPLDASPVYAPRDVELTMKMTEENRKTILAAFDLPEEIVGP